MAVTAVCHANFCRKMLCYGIAGNVKKRRWLMLGSRRWLSFYAIDIKQTRKTPFTVFVPFLLAKKSYLFSKRIKYYAC